VISLQAHIGLNQPTADEKPGSGPAFFLSERGELARDGSPVCMRGPELLEAAVCVGPEGTYDRT
jgi:hypothetical protein